MTKKIQYSPSENEKQFRVPKLIFQLYKLLQAVSNSPVKNIFIY